MKTLYEKIKNVTLLTTVEVTGKNVTITHIPYTLENSAFLFTELKGNQSRHFLVPVEAMMSVCAVARLCEIEPESEFVQRPLSDGVSDILAITSRFEEQALINMLCQLGGTYRFKNLLWLDGIKGGCPTVGIEEISYSEDKGLMFDAYSDSYDPVGLDNDSFSTGDFCNILQTIEKELDNSNQ